MVILFILKIPMDLSIGKKYDENNNCIYFKDSDGNGYQKEYDENNNLINFKDSSDEDEW